MRAQPKRVDVMRVPIAAPKLTTDEAYEADKLEDIMGTR